MSAGASAARTGAFVAKETSDVFHQPRLLATLVLGPFLVMGAFGIGLSDQLPRFSVVFVAPGGARVGEVVARYAEELAGYIDYRGVTSDESLARERLAAGEVDVVAVLPDRPLDAIRDDRRAVIEVYHRSLDPIVGAAVEGAARLAADEINRQVLASIVAEGQAAAVLVDTVLPRVLTAVAAARDALERGERALAEARIDELSPELREVTDDVANTLSLSGGAAGALSGGAIDAGDVRRVVRQLQLPPSVYSAAERAAQLDTLETALEEATRNLEYLGTVRPEVLIRPFRARTHAAEPALGSPLAFYAPSILVLLLQHLGVTFASLSLVRERDLGAVELFAVAPVTSGEIVLGKCISYVLLGTGVGAVLFLATRTGLDLPLAGSVAEIAVFLLAVVAASAGIGFLISLVARRDSQAVQLAMLSLLASFFFSGFFLPLDRLGTLAERIGALLPATHGITIARAVMLRDETVPVGDVLQLAAIAAVTLVLTWRGFARDLRRV